MTSSTSSTDDSMADSIKDSIPSTLLHQPKHKVTYFSLVTDIDRHFIIKIISEQFTSSSLLHHLMWVCHVRCQLIEYLVVGVGVVIAWRIVGVHTVL